MRYTCIICGRSNTTSMARRRKVLGRDVCRACASKHGNWAQLSMAVQRAIDSRETYRAPKSHHLPVLDSVRAFTSVSPVASTSCAFDSADMEISPPALLFTEPEE